MNKLFQNNRHPNKPFTYEDCHFALSQYQKETGHTPFFISGWDVDSNVLLPRLIAKQTIPSIEQNINKYYLVEDGNGCNIVSKYFRDHLNIFLPPDQIMIGNSATSLLCLALLSIVSVDTENQALVLEPSYYSVHDTFDLTRCSFQTIHASIPNFTYDYDRIEHIVQEKRIKMIVATDPFFGSGIPIDSNGYQRLVDIVNRYHCIFVVDMARMGLFWNIKDEPILGERFSMICKAEEYVVVYSPCKKVFANGIKTGILISSPNVMKRLQIYSDSVLGSVSASQIAFLNTLLSDESYHYISHQIATNILLAKKHYDILYALLYHSDCSLIQPQMGHYALVTCPTRGNTEWDIFLKLLYEAKVYTLPMGLYGFPSSSFYNFRVNLLAEIGGVVNGIECIMSTLKNSEL